MTMSNRRSTRQHYLSHSSSPSSGLRAHLLYYLISHHKSSSRHIAATTLLTFALRLAHIHIDYQLLRSFYHGRQWAIISIVSLVVKWHLHTDDRKERVRRFL